MRVFVVGTGRCGTATFYQACRHITNYTCAHESQAYRIPDYEYPDNHIEVSHMNIIAIPHLRERYRDSLFVHLFRERESCISSLIQQIPLELKAWSIEWYLRDDLPVGEIAPAYYDRVKELCNRLCTCRVEVEKAKIWWTDFWDAIKAEGNQEEALKEFDRRYNPSVNRGRDNFVEIQ